MSPKIDILDQLCTALSRFETMYGVAPLEIRMCPLGYRQWRDEAAAYIAENPHRGDAKLHDGPDTFLDVPIRCYERLAPGVLMTLPVPRP